MLIRPNTNVVEGVVLDAQGNPTSVPTKLLTTEDAIVLRAYKKFLEAHGIRTSSYCNECFQGNLSDGMEAHVTDGEILFRCRHRMLYYKGSSY